MNTHITKKTGHGQSVTSRFFWVMMFAWILSIVGYSSCFAATVTLSWDPNTEATLAGYKVYYKADTSTLPFNGTGAVEGASPINVNNQTTATVSGLDPTKTYYFAVTSYDTSGVESSYSNIVTVLELYQPTTAITAPVNNSTVSGIVSVVASVSDNVSVTKLEFYVNGILQATDTATPYVYSWNTSTLASGTYTLMTKAYDAAGNVGQSSNVAVTIVNDITAPTVSLSAPANGATLGGTVSVTASASDNVGVSKVEFYNNGTLLFAGNVAPYTYNWNTNSIANGNYTLTARAYDNVGNIGQSSSVSVTVFNDSSAPTVTAFSIPATASFTTVAITSLTASDNVAVTGYLVTESATTPAAGATGWTVSVPTSFTFAADGSRTAYAWARDAAGNVSSSRSASVTITLPDTTAPVVSAFSMPATATVLSVPVSSLTATDNVGVTGYLVTESATAPAAGATGWTASVPTSFTFSAAGSRTAYAWARDAAGNISAARNSSVIITLPDTTLPTISITSPANNATISGSVSVVGAASDNIGVSKVEFYLNNVLQSSSSTAPYSFNWNTTSGVNGIYTLFARAYDASGNAGQSTSIDVAVNNAVITPEVTYTAVFGNASGADYPGTVQDTFLNINNEVNASNMVLNTYTWPENTPANAILMKWDISALPANAQIQSATLSLSLTGSGGDASYEIPVSQIINKQPVIANSNGNTYDGINSWTASSVPYGGIPLAQSDIGPVVDAPIIDNAYGYKNWNVTNIVKDWMVTPGNNLGLLLNSSNKASSDSNRIFSSSEAVDATQRPKLVVTYTLPSATLPSGNIDGYGGVDLTDVLLALQIAVGKVTATSDQLVRGDVAPVVNGISQPNGKIDIADVIVILGKVVGI